MKKKNKAKNIWLGVIIFIALIIVVYLIAPANLQKFTNNKIEYSQNGTSEATTFESKYLKFRINLASKFHATDETSRIIVTSPLGEIYVNRDGTQFNDLEGYINDFDNSTTLNFQEDERSVINGYNARARIIEENNLENREKIYFIYIDNYIYMISTKEEVLFDDLDQIAKSFRYTP